MGLAGNSPMSLILILLIVLVLFGGKRLRSLGSDLGGAIRGFRGSMQEAEAEETVKPRVEDQAARSGTSTSTTREREQS